ncbi:hypothetical protein U0070_016278, partial [Myodes glareolus]
VLCAVEVSQEESVGNILYSEVPAEGTLVHDLQTLQAILVSSCQYSICNAVEIWFLPGEIWDSIRSPTFSTGDNDKWCLRVHSNRVQEESTGYLSCCSAVQRVTFGQSFSSGSQAPKEKKTQRAYQIFPEDEFTFLYKVSMVKDSFKICKQKVKQRFQVVRSTLAAELRELWENSCFTDCCLKAAGQEFWALKAILTA